MNILQLAILQYTFPISSLSLLLSNKNKYINLTLIFKILLLLKTIVYVTLKEYAINQNSSLTFDKSLLGIKLTYIGNVCRRCVGTVGISAFIKEGVSNISFSNYPFVWHPIEGRHSVRFWMGRNTPFFFFLSL